MSGAAMSGIGSAVAGASIGGSDIAYKTPFQESDLRAEKARKGS